MQDSELHSGESSDFTPFNEYIMIGKFRGLHRYTSSTKDVTSMTANKHTPSVS